MYADPFLHSLQILGYLILVLLHEFEALAISEGAELASHIRNCQRPAEILDKWNVSFSALEEVFVGDAPRLAYDLCSRLDYLQDFFVRRSDLSGLWRARGEAHPCSTGVSRLRISLIGSRAFCPIIPAAWVISVWP
jgi:hypothetical protein